MKVKIHQTTWFLELQNHDWGLRKGVFSSKYLLGCVCGGRGEPRFKHKTESETDILYAFLWVAAWSGIHLKQILLVLCLWYSRTTHWLEAFRDSWCGSGLSLLESILKLCVPCFKETAISLPFFWSPCCGMWHVMMLGKEWAFLGGGGMGSANSWDSHLRSFACSLWYPGQVTWLPYLISIICKIRQILFVFQISPILTTRKTSWANWWDTEDI